MGLGWPPEPAERDWRRSLQGQTRGSRERVGAGPGSQEASENMPGNALRLHLKFQLLANLLPQERVSHQWGGQLHRGRTKTSSLQMPTRRALPGPGATPGKRASRVCTCPQEKSRCPHLLPGDQEGDDKNQNI